MKNYQHPVGQPVLPTSLRHDAARDEHRPTMLLLVVTVNRNVQRNSHGAIRDAEFVV
jgi:hypothetical protein